MAKDNTPTTTNANKQDKKPDYFMFKYKKYDYNNLSAADIAAIKAAKPTAAQLGRFAKGLVE